MLQNRCASTTFLTLTAVLASTWASSACPGSRSCACPESLRESLSPPTIPETKLLPASVAAYDVAGQAVAVSGNIAVIGSPLDDDNGAASGSAFVFRWNGTLWVQEALLLADGGAAYDRFGCAVSIDGDRIAIGARYADMNGGNSGAVYLYRFNSSIWAPEAILVPTDATPFNDFGSAVALRGDRVLVGARFDDQEGLESGAAFVFRLEGNDWVQEAKLTATDAAPFDQFGTAVALDAGVALIGAPLSDPEGWAAGAAYVFHAPTRNGGTWIQEAKLEPIGLPSSGQFGNSVSLAGHTAVIGAWGDDEIGWDAGAAYVFEYGDGAWTLDAKLTAFDADGGEYFGCGVSVRGPNILVGSPLSAASGPANGAAYRYHRQESLWTSAEKLTPASNAPPSGFGFSVAIDSSAYLVGAPFDDSEGTEAGCAFVFTILDPLFADLNGDGSVNQLDLAILLGAWAVQGGPADLDQDGLVGQEDLALLLGAWTIR
jgi:hypothetical protein